MIATRFELENAYVTCWCLLLGRDEITGSALDATSPFYNPSKLLILFLLQVERIWDMLFVSVAWLASGLTYPSTTCDFDIKI